MFYRNDSDVIIESSVVILRVYSYPFNIMRNTAIDMSATNCNGQIIFAETERKTNKISL